MKPQSALLKARHGLQSWLALVKDEAATLEALWREAAEKAGDASRQNLAVEILSIACNKEHKLTGDCEHSARLAAHLGLEEALDAYDEAHLHTAIRKSWRSRSTAIRKSWRSRSPRSA